MGGETVLEPEVTSKMMHRMRHGNSTPLYEQLTEREMEVLLLMARVKPIRKSLMSYILP